MKENIVPKWQEELRSFIGIKSGIILEGYVHDEFLTFSYEADEAVFDDVGDLDNTVLSLVDQDDSDVFFFDPVDGFYCPEGPVETQKARLKTLTNEYSCNETYRDHGCTICLMPEKKTNSGEASETERYIFVSEIIRRAMLSDRNAFTEKANIIFVMNFASRMADCNIRSSDSNEMFLNLMASTTGSQSSQTFCNTLIMVVDKYNDIPAWVYMNNPNIRTISVSVPDRTNRRLFIKNLRGELALYSLLGDDDYDPGKQFVAETEGLQLQELRQVLLLAYRKKISPESIDTAFRLYKYGLIDNPWENLENDILSDIDSILNERVKGQADALKKVKTVATRAVRGLSGLQHSGASHKPKGVLFFAGPTGVGKTETAKALAEAIFGDENACIRFDMSEYRMEHSDQKLFGAPPGYVGYDVGGQLTNAVKNRPFSVILFDEIEKASPTILDKFLQILEDGRMTDNQGNTVYFGETIIIFTSNIGLTKEVVDPDDPFTASRHRVATITIEDPEDPTIEDTPEHRDRVTELLTEGVKAYFTDNGRPELLNRLGDDNIVVFQFINVEDAKTICDYKLGKICDQIKAEKNIEIITEEITGLLHEKAVLERANGGRGVGNMLERDFINPLSVFLSALSKEPSVIRCHTEEKDVVFEVMM